MESCGFVGLISQTQLKVLDTSFVFKPVPLNSVWHNIGVRHCFKSILIFQKGIFRYHVQKCNENSLVFFSLTLNNRNRWDCLGMLEFVFCLPKTSNDSVIFPHYVRTNRPHFGKQKAIVCHRLL